jgi:hypothetical protein
MMLKRTKGTERNDGSLCKFEQCTDKMMCIHFVRAILFMGVKIDNRFICHQQLR